MPPLSLPALSSGSPTAWEEAVYAFLVEKRARSGSTRTVESYARMLWPFFRVRTPDRVRSSDVLAYAHGIGLLLPAALFGDDPAGLSGDRTAALGGDAAVGC